MNTSMHARDGQMCGGMGGLARFIRAFPMAFMLLGMISFNAKGGFVYSDDFDSGTSPFTASPYFSNHNNENGLIVKSENFFGQIGSDVSTSGYFLFNGTNLNNGPPIPTDQNAFYISPTFAVTANTNYVLSFYLTNIDPSGLAQVQPQISGNTIGGPVSAIGTWSTNGWQRFSFSFNSGAATFETLTLVDLTTTQGGNDFGTDDIVIATAVPEPSSLIQFGIAGLVGVGAASLYRYRAEWAAGRWRIGSCCPWATRKGR
jgi:hypothetical protein